MLEKFSVNPRITEEFPPVLRPGIVIDDFMEDETFDLLGSVEDIDSFLNFSKDAIVDPAAAADFPPLADPLSVDDALLGATPGCVALVPPLGQEDASKLAAFDELDIAAADMDWVSHFLEDSVPYSVDFATITTGNNGSSGSSFRTSSPISVLEPNSLACGGTSSTPSSSSSSSSCGFGGSSNTMNGNPFVPISSHPEAVVIPGRARTKRPRPASFSSRMQVTIPASERESCGEYNPPAMKKLKKEKKNPSVSAAGGEEAGPPPVRKCTHCEVTKTPQWRAGPRGPKTLCNACGVRYKSGRLFPEYRPAVSPTFIPSCHSNSHKKVVEMRIKANQKDGMPLPDNPAIKGCDLLQFIRRRD